MRKKKGLSKGTRRLAYKIRHLSPEQAAESGPEILSLETFTDAHLSEWLSQAEALQNYHYKWYFDLEGQRAAKQHEIREALASQGVCSVPLEGWGRQLDIQYVDLPLSAYGSLEWAGGRFNYGRDIDLSRFAPFPALYLAENPETAFREHFQIARHGRRAGLKASELALAQDKSFAWYRVEGEVHNVFDATSATRLKAFAKIISAFKVSAEIRELEKRLALERPLEVITTAASLLSSLRDDNWRHWPVQFNLPANSQVFGRLLIDAGFEAILYRSTKSGARCLAVFTRQLKHSGTVVRLASPFHPGVIFSELSASNCMVAERCQVRRGVSET